jgi:hypothetical protein
MLPRWSQFQLRAKLRDLGPWPNSPVEVVEAAAGDAELVRWDTEINGHHRPEDHTYWVARRGGIPLWFTLYGQPVGYGYAQTHSDDSLQESDAITVGPIGSRAAADAVACVGAALRWARARGATVRIAVPGPHPALAALLNTGFRIAEMETFSSTTEDACPDLRRYISSGSDLF